MPSQKKARHFSSYYNNQKGLWNDRGITGYAEPLDEDNNGKIPKYQSMCNFVKTFVIFKDNKIFL